MLWIKKNSYVLIFSLVTLLIFYALFISRDIDDNRLTSWESVFTGVGAARFFLILISGLISAYVISRNSLLERHPVICLFFVSYAVAFLFWSEPEVIVDASRYFTQAKHLEVYGIGYFLREWGGNIAAWTDMPAVPFFYGIIFKFIGECRIYIQIFTTFLFSLTVVFTCHIGKTLWNEDVGLFGGLLLLGIPYLFTQVPLMLVDVPVMFFLTLSIFAFIKAISRGGWFIALSVSSIFITFFSKYSAWLMLSILFVIYIVFIVQYSRRKMQDTRCTPLLSPLTKGGREGGCRASDSMNHAFWTRGLAVAGISAVLIGIVFWYKFDVFSEQINLLITYQKPGLKRWGESFLSTFFFQVHPLMTFAALYSVYAAIRKRDFKYIIIIWLVLLIILFQIRRIRYIIMVFPMLSLMAAYGLAHIKKREAVKFASLTIAACSIIIAVFIYRPFLEKMSGINLKNAGEFLNSINKPDVEVFTLVPAKPVLNPAVSVPVLDLFTTKRIFYNPAVPDFAAGGAEGLPEEEIKESSLRFTWEYRNPGYYSGGEPADKNNSAVVVISNETGEELPYYIRQRVGGFHETKGFNLSENIFSYQTFVTVYY